MRAVGRLGALFRATPVIDLCTLFRGLPLAATPPPGDRYYGAEPASAEVESEADLRMFVEVDGAGAIIRSEMLTRDIDIHGWQDG